MNGAWLARSCRIRAARTAALIALAMMAPSATAAQESAAVVAGRVTSSETRQPIVGAEVRLEGHEELRNITDAQGRFLLLHVPPGPQVLRVEQLGYAAARRRITVPATGTLTVDVALAESALRMEGITVTADPTGRARGELASASVIETEAIRNQAAVSLAGVLELMPGGELSVPGLSSLQQVALRSAPTTNIGTGGGMATAADLANFGTLIVLDGVPLSNNANLQTAGAGAVGLIRGTSGGGIDLRRIPASTLERVEVIRGVPSARWGDLTQGAIIVETRAGRVPLETRGQLDARTSSGTVLGGGHVVGDQVATVSFDVARTRSQPGVTDDYGYRLATQALHRADAGEAPDGMEGPRLRLDTRVDYYRLIEDEPENPDVRPGFASYTRDSGLRVSERARLAVDARTRLEFTGSVSWTRQRSFRQLPRSRGAQPVTSRLEPGRAEGRYLGGEYIAEAFVDGDPWLLFGRIEGITERDAFGFEHELLAGVEFRREWNAGPGYQFDIEFPPQIEFNGVQGFNRPRAYDDIPAMALGALYVSDRMRQRVFGAAILNLQAGLRLDALAEGEWRTSGARDVVVQPRLNTELIATDWLRLRGGWGTTAKAPPLALLYPAPQYHDVINVNHFANDPAERLAVLTTFVLDPTNPDLGFARGTKAEAGFELGGGDAVLSVVGFSDRIEDGAGILPRPTFLLREHYDLIDTPGDGLPPVLVEPAASADTVPIILDRPANHIDIDSRGIEVTAFLPEIRPLRLRVQVQGLYIETDQSSRAVSFGSTTGFNNFQLIGQPDRIPYWDGALQTGEKTVLTYRLIHHQPAAGLVITATVQHNVHEAIEDVALTDTLAFAGYLTRDGRLVEVPRSERTRPEYADLRTMRTGALEDRRTAPARWMASLQVAKDLPFGGRLTFWAFNFLDRSGQVFELDRLSRPYPSMRFGLDLTMPLGDLWPGS